MTLSDNIYLEERQKEFLKVLHADMANMLASFKVTAKKYPCYFVLLNEHNIHVGSDCKTCWYELLNGWIKLLKQFVPVQKYKMIACNNLSPNPDQQKSFNMLCKKLMTGESINDSSLKLLPDLKRMGDVDLFEEQSKIRHFHLPVKGVRQNEVLIAECNFVTREIIIHGLSDHLAMKKYAIYNDHFVKSTIKINGLPVSEEARLTKDQERGIIKAGWSPINVIEDAPTMRRPLNVLIHHTLIPGIIDHLRSKAPMKDVLENAKRWCWDNC